MPQIKIIHVVSFSSEDTIYPASNLLSNDIVNKRWVGQKGETSNSVVLQLEKSVQISQIHVGTYHSAFIEVLVGRSEANNQPYEVIVCASSFMNPSDSRNSENVSRVKTFSGDQLSPEVRTKNWDRIRVVCTQPYNKHVQFGLSFINFFSSESDSSSMVTPEQSASQSSQSSILGRFKLRDPSPDEDDTGDSYTSGELFARHKHKGTISIDAQIRQAGTPASLNASEKCSSLFVKASRPSKPKKASKYIDDDDDNQVLPRARDQLLYNDDDEKNTDKIDKVINRDREEKAKLKEKEQKSEDATKTLRKDLPSSDKKTSQDIPKTSKNNMEDKKEKIRTPAQKKTRIEKDDEDGDKSRNKIKNPRKRESSSDSNAPSTSKKARSDEQKTQSVDAINITRGPKCLQGVVFVLSGYVNPKRSNLRDAGISLGARYSPDWTPQSTHLLCAFSNTPKHDQVKRSGAKAIIVRGQWIEDCEKEQAHLPWKWYAMDPMEKISRPAGPLPTSEVKTDDEDESISSIRDTTQVSASTSAKQDFSDSECDTDDEIEKVMQQQKLKDSIKSEVKNVPKSLLLDSDSTTDIDEDIVNKFTEKQSQKSDNKKATLNTSLKKKPVLFNSDESDQDVNKTQKIKNKNSEESSSKSKQVDDIKLYLSDDSQTENENTIYSAKTPSKKASLNTHNYSTVTEDLSENKDFNTFDDSGLDEALPDLYSGIYFYIDPKLENTNYGVEELKRYVLAYKGEILDTWPNKKVDVTITIEKYVDSLKLNAGKKCQFLRPEWVWKCNDTESLFSFEEYKIG